MLAGAALTTLAQRDDGGGPESPASYGPRAHVEGIVGNLRNPSTQDIRRGFRRVMGLSMTTLSLAFEEIDAEGDVWSAATGDPRPPGR